MLEHLHNFSGDTDNAELNYMTPEKSKLLFDAFPSIYRGRVKLIEESLMSFGFESDDGWFDLIWTLSQKIEDAAKAPGLNPQCDSWPETTQVKEKFGIVRFHLNNHNEVMNDLISEAQEVSAKTCEICGSPGSRVVGRRVKTLCDIHAKEFFL
ncbi:MAG: hypothetical protein ABL885_15360 [Methylophilaceae bacterium]